MFMPCHYPSDLLIFLTVTRSNAMIGIRQETRKGFPKSLRSFPHDHRQEFE